MKFVPRRLPTAATAFLVLVSAARAHPGHEGHELTWDFSHLAQHPFATIGCAAVAGAVCAGLLQILRRRSELRVQTLRVAQRTRGK